MIKPQNSDGGNSALQGTGLDAWLGLLALGYEPIPILAAEKKPLIKGWTSGEITEGGLKAWAVQYPDHTSTGCRTGRLVGVDVDIVDPKNAAAVAVVVQEIMGLSMFERIGSKGLALYYQNSGPIPKIRVFGKPPGWKPGTKNRKPDPRQGVEFFGTGGQMVTFGIHPTTGEPYAWPNSSILDHPIDHLPQTTPSKIREAAAAVKTALEALGYTDLPDLDIGERAPDARQTHDGDPITPKMLEALLSHIDPSETEISGSWIAIMCGIKYSPLIDAEDFDRFDLFDRWSAGELNPDHAPGNYEGADDCERHWKTKYPQDKRATGSGLGTIIHHARKGGYSESIRVSYIERLLGKGAVASAVGTIDGVTDADIPQDVADAADWFTPIMELNERFAIVTGGKHGGRVVDVSSPREPHFLNGTLFHSMFAHVWIAPPMTADNPKPKRLTVSRMWETWEGRREITGIEFVPPGAHSRLPKGAHNLWQGFAVEPKEGEAFKGFIDHVRDNVCGGDEDAFEWIITWMTDLVQNPGHKPGAAIALIGEQGVGKTIFYRFLKEIFGTHAASVSDSNKVIGNFNAHMAGLVVLGVEEGFWAGDKRAEAKLRDMITSPTMNLEQKGVDSIEIANHVHIVVTSNERWVVPIAFDDRRWTVFDVLPTRKNDRTFWEKIHEDLEGEGPANLLHYLLGRTNSPRHVLFTPFGTKAKIGQATETMDSVNQWWLDVLRGDRHPTAGRNLSEEDKGRADGIFGADTLKATILHDYQTWCSENPNLRRLTPNSFWKSFRGVMGQSLTLHRPRPAKGDKARPVKAWFAPRDTCQGAFAERLQAEWSDLE